MSIIVRQFPQLLALISTVLHLYLPPSHAHTADTAKAGSNFFTMDKILSVERLTDAYFSPNGDWVSYRWTKPIKEFKKSSQTFLSPSHYSGTALYNMRTRKTIRLDVDGYDSLSPGPWSPDGNKIVLFSINSLTGKSQTSVYNVNNGKYRRLPGTQTYPTTHWVGPAPHTVWLDDNTLVYSASPDGLTPLLYAGPDYQDPIHTLRNIYNSTEENKPQYTIYETAPIITISHTQKSKLLKINVLSGRTKVLLEGDVQAIEPSPDGQYIAVVRRGNTFIAPSKGTRLAAWDATGLVRDQIYIVDVTGANDPIILSDPGGSNIMFPISWSPDGKLLAYYAIPPGEIRFKAKPYIYDLNTRHASPLLVGDLNLVDTPAIASSDTLYAKKIFFLNRRPAVIASDKQQKSSTGSPKSALSSDRQNDDMIWSLSPKFHPEILISDAQNIIPLCWNHDKLTFLLKGELSQLPYDNADLSIQHLSPPPMDITSAFCSPIASSFAQKNDFGVLLSRTNNQTFDANYSLWDFRNGKLMRLITLSHGDHILDIATSDGTILFQRTDDRGQWLFVLTSDNQQPMTIARFNAWKDKIEPLQVGKVEYQVPGTPHQSTYTGWYILPRHYVPGKKYPVVVNVYPGQVWTSSTFNRNHPELSVNPYYQPLLAAEQGIITFYVSAPINAELKPLDIPQQLANSTLSAVNALLATGAADSDRLALQGHSGGGYATAAILTKTDIFRAAIATGGLYNLTSAYGTFAPTNLNHPDAAFDFFQAGLIEGDWLQLGSPPWHAPDVYFRNSPIFSVDKITTPILLMQSDLDYVPISQPEELFTGLAREGKIAKFIRLWADDHVPSRPEHIRFTWDQCLSWLKTYLIDENSL